MPLTPAAFIAKWQGSAGDERANKDSFLREFCEALGLDAPGPKDASPDYCYEKETPALLATEEAAVPAAVDIRPWPTDRRAQFAALRDLLQSGARLWTLEQLARSFKSRGRYRDSIQAHLGVLEDLGLAERLDGPTGPRWHRPSAAVG